MKQISFPYSLKVKFKINKIINKNKSAKCGIIFEMKDGDNFYATYIEKEKHKKNNFLLIKAYSKDRRKEKKVNNYKFEEIKKIKNIKFDIDKWYILNIIRNKKSVKIRLIPGDIYVLKSNISKITKECRISLITYNADCFFKSLEINKKNKEIVIPFNNSIKIKRLFLEHRIEQFHNPTFGP